MIKGRDRPRNLARKGKDLSEVTLQGNEGSLASRASAIGNVPKPSSSMCVHFLAHLLQENEDQLPAFRKSTVCWWTRSRGCALSNRTPIFRGADTQSSRPLAPLRSSVPLLFRTFPLGLCREAPCDKQGTEILAVSQCCHVKARCQALYFSRAGQALCGSAHALAGEPLAHAEEVSGDRSARLLEQVPADRALTNRGSLGVQAAHRLLRCGG